MPVAAIPSSFELLKAFPDDCDKDTILFCITALEHAEKEDREPILEPFVENPWRSDIIHILDSNFEALLARGQVCFGTADR